MKRFRLKGLLLVMAFFCFWLVLAGLAREYAQLKLRYSHFVSTVPPSSGCRLESVTYNDIYVGVGSDTLVRVRLVKRNGDQEREIGRTTVSQGTHVLSFFHNCAEGEIGYSIDGNVQSARCPPNARPAVKPAMNIYTAPDWEILWQVNARDFSEQSTVEIQEEQIAS
jgi:hypothetical protein